jgi:hypothetical protein
LKKLEIDLPKPFDNPFNAITRDVTEAGDHILLFILEHELSNIYSIEKGLSSLRPRITASTIRKKIYEGELRTRVLYTERQQKRNKKQKTKLFVLSKEGYESVLYLLYSNDFLGSDKKRIQMISELYSQLKNYKLANFPKVFDELFDEYLIVFYPYFKENLFLKDNLVNSFVAILKAKLNNPDETDFIVNNTVFKISIQVTEKEIELILKFTEELVNQEESYLNERIASIHKMKELFQDIKSKLLVN